MYFTIPTIALFAALSSAAPSAYEGAEYSPLSSRQGGYYSAVGNKYSGPGCTASTLIFADPIFGYGNSCQALDRSGTGVPIVSYSTIDAYNGCTVAIYTSTDCSGTAYQAPKGGCVTGTAPFRSTYVTCPPSAPH